MLESLLNSENKEQVLIFLVARELGYATEIARFFHVALFGIQKQLDKLEEGGILISKKVGRTRTYEFNRRYALLKELKNLLERALTFYPDDIQDDLLMNRRRPRTRGKPL